MVSHVVIFTWRLGVTEQEARAFGSALDRLASDLSDVATIQHGADLRFRDGNGDYGLVATFADRPAWDAYQAHPKHRAFLQDQVAPLVASRVAIQF